MSWKVHKQDDVIIAVMNSNKANLHNPDFFRDFHEAFDHMDSHCPENPVVLTAEGNIFSAGIDFNYSFELFGSGDKKRVADWFAQYRKMMLRLFEMPRLTVAAINGHTFAGGVILALCCDFRIASQGTYKMSINEVPVGVPMPSVYTEIIRFRLGNPNAIETILSGEVYNLEQAKALGLVKKIVAPEDLISAAIQQAKIISPEAYTAYRHSKKMLQYPALQAIQNYSTALEPEMFEAVCAPESCAAQRAALERIQKN